MISTWLLFLISVILMLSFLMLMQSHTINLVKLLTVQNIFLALYLSCKTLTAHNLELYISLSLMVILKVIILPWLLWKLTLYLQLSHRIEPIVKKPTLLLTGIILAVFAFLLSHQMQPFIGGSAIVGFSLSLANIFIAVLLIVFRRKAISQVIGLLVMENSIFLLSATLTHGFPWLVELGMSFDVLIGFMIFALFLLRIRATYGSLQTYHLEKLRERV